MGGGGAEGQRCAIGEMQQNATKCNIFEEIADEKYYIADRARSGGSRPWTGGLNMGAEPNEPKMRGRSMRAEPNEPKVRGGFQRGEILLNSRAAIEVICRIWCWHENIARRTSTM